MNYESSIPDSTEQHVDAVNVKALLLPYVPRHSQNITDFKTVFENNNQFWDKKH